MRIKINKLVVAALYWDGIIPFTSLNAFGPIKTNPRNIVMLYVAIFTISKTRMSARLSDCQDLLNG